MKAEEQAGADVVIGEPGEQDSVMRNQRQELEELLSSCCCYDRLWGIPQERIKSKTHRIPCLPPSETPLVSVRIHVMQTCLSSCKNR